MIFAESHFAFGLGAADASGPYDAAPEERRLVTEERCFVTQKRRLVTEEGRLVTGEPRLAEHSCDIHLCTGISRAKTGVPQGRDVTENAHNSS